MSILGNPENTIMKGQFSCRLLKSCLVVTIVTTAMLIFLEMISVHNVSLMDYTIIPIKSENNYQNTSVIEWRELWKNQKNISKLGRILFLGEEPAVVKRKKKYQILVWKYGPKLEKRLIKQYTNKRIDPFQECSVSNCDITYKDAAIKTADIVIIHLHRTRSLAELPPKRGRKDQIWTFLTDESPYHTFMGNSKLPSKNGKKITIADFNGIFNWSMSYRIDSDIPVPYGRTVVKKNRIHFQENPKRRDVLIAVMVSNCKTRNNRFDYIKELQKYIQADIYGNCGTLKCPGHFSKDCPLLDNYLFYLSFENSNCDGYITEKLWWNAFHKHSIPIVMGGSNKNYKQLLPPNSYINVEDFAGPASLAQFILRLNETNEFQNYYKWKTDFEVLNEHGYFQSKAYHYCRICEAMNYNDKHEKVYYNLQDMWDYHKMCHPAWNIPN